MKKIDISFQYLISYPFHFLILNDSLADVYQRPATLEKFVCLFSRVEINLPIKKYLLKPYTSSNINHFILTKSSPNKINSGANLKFALPGCIVLCYFWSFSYVIPSRTLPITVLYSSSDTQSYLFVQLIFFLCQSPSEALFSLLRLLAS